jgi:hypothetical protein
MEYADQAVHESPVRATGNAGTGGTPAIMIRKGVFPAALAPTEKVEAAIVRQMRRINRYMLYSRIIR